MLVFIACDSGNASPPATSEAPRPGQAATTSTVASPESTALTTSSPPLDIAATTVPADLSTLADLVFLPTAIEGYMLPPDSRLRLWFRTNRIAGIAGCNSFGADASIVDGRLVTSNFSGTLVGCSDQLQEEQNWIETLLSSNPSISVDGPSIRLESDGVTVTFTDEEIADPDHPLEGPTWVFDAIETGTTGARVTGTLTLDEGTLRIVDGCTTGTATFTVDGPTLLVAHFEWQPADCPGIVHTFTIAAAFAQPVSFDIAANRLTLEAPDGTTMHLHIPR